MKKSPNTVAAVLTLAIMLSFFAVGCGDTASEPDASVTQDTSGLALLEASDRAAAEGQKLCPVTDKPLGSMGTPPKVSIDGQEVFICCSGCENSLRDDSATYLAKIVR